MNPLVVVVITHQYCEMTLVIPLQMFLGILNTIIAYTQAQLEQ
jgi:hypothetical protein